MDRFIYSELQNEHDQHILEKCVLDGERQDLLQFAERKCKEAENKYSKDESSKNFTVKIFWILQVRQIQKQLGV